jgi:heme a synthase
MPSPVLPPLSSAQLTRFRRWAVASTLIVYFLIFVGGLVRVSGAGMGCPDWPKCFGLWIPPTDASELPPQYDKTNFNVVLTWVEYINRLIGVFTGFVILITAALAVKNFRRVPKILVPTVAALVLTGVQGWLGKVVVATDLHPVIVTLHLVLALIIVSILVYAAQQAYYLESPNAIYRGSASHEKTSIPAHHWILVLWIAALAQVALGTQVREKLELLVSIFPLMTEPEWIEETGLIGKLHGAYGTLLSAATWVCGYRILRMPALPPLVRNSTYLIMGLMLAQLIVGISLVKVGIPQVMQIFHQWISSLYIGALLALYVALKPSRVAAQSVLTNQYV